MKRLVSALLTLCLLIGVFPLAQANGGIELELVNGEYVVTAYSGSESELLIPSRVQDIPVTAIAEKAFADNATLVTVTVSSSVKRIEQGAFSGCSALKEIILSEGLEYVGKSAFANCVSLETFVFPESVTELGTTVFNSCEALRTVTLPQNIKSIPDYMFEYCSSLEEVICANDLQYIGLESFMRCPSLKAFRIPATVKELGANPFIGCKAMTLTIDDACKRYAIENDMLIDTENATLVALLDMEAESFTAPENVTVIDKAALMDCDRLTSVNLHEGITEIGWKGFAYCSSLKGLELPSSLCKIGYEAFRNCSSLESLTIPEGVEASNTYTFYYCTALKSLTLPSSMKTLEDGFLSHTDSLSSVVLPDSVESIDEYAFSNADLLVVIKTDTVTDATVKAHESCLTRYKLPVLYVSPSLPDEVVAQKVRSETSRLAAEKVKAAVPTPTPTPKATAAPVPTETPKPALDFDCTVNSDNTVTITRISTTLDVLEIPGTVEGMQVTALGENAAKDLSARVVIVPEGVKTIGKKCFYSADMEEIVLPSTLTEIEAYGFQYCSSLKSVEIPAGVTVIKFYAFADCSSLKHITLSDETTLIGESAFRDCSALESLYLPKSAEVMEQSFIGCENLTLSLSEDNPYLELTDGCLIRREDGTLLVYANPSESVCTVPEGIRAIGINAFSDLQYVREVKLPESLTSIDEFAFLECNSLEKLIIPSGVTHIGESSLSQCAGIKSIILPKSLKQLGVFRIQYNGALEYIVAPRGLQCMDYYSVADNPVLGPVFLPDTVSEMDAKAIAHDEYSPNVFVVTTGENYASAWAAEQGILWLKLSDRDGINARMTEIGTMPFTDEQFDEIERLLNLEAEDLPAEAADEKTSEAEPEPEYQSEPESEDQAIHLKDYLTDGFIQTPDSLLYYADRALSDGMDPQLLGEELMEAAEEHNVTDLLLYSIENIAAFEGKSYNKLLKYTSGENDYHSLDLWTVSPYASADGFYAYGRTEVSDELKKVFEDSSAQYCFDPCYWFENDFSKAFGTEYSKFKPSSPRPGYACVIIKAGTQTNAKTKWTDSASNSSTVERTMRNAVAALMNELGDDAPVLTGNPNLASTFWVFSMSWPYYAQYKFTTGDIVKGYNCKASLSVVNASSKKSIASVSDSERLPRQVSVWGIPEYLVPEDTPFLEENGKFASFVEKTRSALVKERASASSDRKITKLNAASVLNGILQEKADGTKEAWLKAIYEAGAQDVKLQGTELTFRMRSFTPDLSTAYADSEDPSGWLAAVMQSTQDYDLEMSLNLEDGRPTKKSLTALNTALKKTATASQKAFGSKNISAALSAMLFPQPVAGKVTDPSEILTVTDAFESAVARFGATPDAWAPFFYAQSKQTLTVKSGPHALTLTNVGGNTESLLKSAVYTVLDSQAFAESDDRLSTDEREAAVKTELAKTAVSMRKSAKDKTTVTIDIDELAKGVLPESYLSFVEAYNYEETLEELNETVCSLPASAAQDMPKTGKISGPGSGTSATIKVPKDGNPTYLQVRDAYTNDLIADCFIHPGKSVSLKIPEGNVRLIYCSGTYWYGTDEMFGPTGVMNKSEITEIKSKKYKHTFTLVSSSDGNLEIYKANPEDFR